MKRLLGKLTAWLKPKPEKQGNMDEAFAAVERSNAAFMANLPQLQGAAEKRQAKAREKARNAANALMKTLSPNTVYSSLKLAESAIETLPEGLEVTLKLDLSNCVHLRELPRGLKAGSLVLTGCTALERLPEDLKASFLRIDGCTALREWPETARVEMGSVNAAGCTRLTKLPAGLGPLANLDISGCSGITALPDGLRISGWLDLGNAGVDSLPESLTGVDLRWRGVRITPQIAFFPETLTGEQILTERNAEVRRVMTERIGLERFVEQVKAEVIHEDTDPGGPRRLLRIPMEGDEPIVCVSVICPSTGRKYLVRVPPTTKTCHQAVAWTAGFDDPDDYRPLVET